MEVSNAARDMEAVLRRLLAGRQRVHTPSLQGSYQRVPGTWFHAVPEVFLQIGGGTDFSGPGGDFRLGTGDVCIMPAGVPHGEVPRDLRTKFETLVSWPVREGFVLLRTRATPEGTMKVVATHRHISPCGQAAFRYLEDISTPVRPSHRRRLEKNLLEAFLITLLGELHRPAVGTPRQSPLIAATEKQARPLLADPALSISRLADLMGYSPDHLSRRFRQECGVSLGQWITRERLALARELLRDSRRTVAEVGWACGFSAPSYFIRVFRGQCGLTPGAWRDTAEGTAPA